MIETSNQLWLNNVENLEQKQNKHVWNHQQSPTSLHYIILYTTQYTTNCHKLMLRIPKTISTVAVQCCAPPPQRQSAGERFSLRQRFGQWQSHLTAPHTETLGCEFAANAETPATPNLSEGKWDQLETVKKKKSVNWWVYWDPTRIPRDS